MTAAHRRAAAHLPARYGLRVNDPVTFVHRQIIAWCTMELFMFVPLQTPQSNPKLKIRMGNNPTLICICEIPPLSLSVKALTSDKPTNLGQRLRRVLFAEATRVTFPLRRPFSYAALPPFLKRGKRIFRQALNKVFIK
jgi:hypothetical protein